MVSRPGSPLRSLTWRWLSLGLLAVPACGKAPIKAPQSPFPPQSRWEQPLRAALSSPLASNGTLVFAASSDGSLTALEPRDGVTVWSMAGFSPGILVARSNLLVLVEDQGGVWGLDPRSGNTVWRTSTQVRGVQSVRLDGNRVFLGGASGFAAVMASTGALQFEVPAKDVRDIDAAGDALASLEEGALTVRNREGGGVRFRLESPEGEFGAPAVFPDGRVVLGSGTRLVRAVSSKGDFGWRFRVGARVKHRPLDFGDGKRVGVVSFEGVFYELSLGGGDMRRRVLLASRPFTAPILDGDRIWAPVFEDEVAAIDPRRPRLLGRTRFGGGFRSPPLLVGDRLLAEVEGPRRIVGLGIVPAQP